MKIAEWIGKWHCLHERHEWLKVNRIGKKLVFHTRLCRRCGLFQIQSAGPTGNDKWVSEEEAFNGIVGDWERGEFQGAVSQQKG